MMKIWPNEFEAHGTHVGIIPLSPAHAPDLEAVIAKSNLHKLLYVAIPEPTKIMQEIKRRNRLRVEGSMQPFAVIDKRTDRVVGMTTYMNIDATTPRLEIGSTWYCPSAQKTGLNTECKLLLLRNAFENLNCRAVEFRTHVMNHKSRHAIERLGAKFDGILRSHMVLPNGAIRDTAVYSIIAAEWPNVEKNLTWQLEKPRP
jgi:RimJ/RimL family protein N-acetyltransferase